MSQLWKKNWNDVYNKSNVEHNDLIKMSKNEMKRRIYINLGKTDS